MATTSDRAIQKTQEVRLVDVFLLGPFMIWAGTNMRHKCAGRVMMIAGVATIAYNWRNYQRAEEG